MIDTQDGKVTITPELQGSKAEGLSIQTDTASVFAGKLETLENVSEEQEVVQGKMPGEFRMAQADCMISYLEGQISNPSPDLTAELKQKENELASALRMKGTDVLRSLRQVPIAGARDPINIIAEITTISALVTEPNPTQLLESLKTAKSSAIEKLHGKKWNVEPQKYDAQDIGSGKKVDVIRHSGFPGIMQYVPQNNSVYIGAGAKPYLEAGNFEILDIAGLHEFEHAIYLSLTAEQQRAINNEIILAAQKDQRVMSILVRFADEMYNIDPEYLKVHSENSTLGIVDNDSLPGVKDQRLITASVTNRESGAISKHRIHMSHMVTELLSYATASQDENLVQLASRPERRSAELVKIAKEFREAMIQHPQLQKALTQNGGMLSKRNLPNMQQYME